MPQTATQLTTEMLARFIGGEAEIQNGGEDYLYRGEISAITIENREVALQFAWLAKNRGGPFGGGGTGPSEDWDTSTNLENRMSLDIYSFSEISEGRVAFNSPIVGEVVVLFPPDGSHIDPTNVHGLSDKIKARQMEKYERWHASH
jgi:hypothetical protein